MVPGFHPLIARWFEGRFGTPTEPQLAGWPHILEGRDTLIAAPTGSGKTLAAFLAALDRLLREGLAGTLGDRTSVLYVSPLKALGNDIRKNLEEPLAGIRAAAEAEGHAIAPLRTQVRTGDTPARERQAMLRKPPHLLITTPESLYVLLTSASGREMLRSVRTVIIDEIHAVARDKRGAHLALSLERLDALTGTRCARIGLSATQRPIEEIARFLVGSARVDAAGTPDCAVVECGARTTLDLAIELPGDELCAVPSKEHWAAVLDRVSALVSAHRTTLVFVNTRQQAERVCHLLGERLGEDAVAAHHGSLSRALRLSAEERLKSAQLKAVVATASLELGIDVGAVELIVQLESPRSFSVAVQRIGRSGHWRGGTPKGRFFPLTRDQLVECAALVRGLRAGELERTRIPEYPLDVLSQQIVAAASCEELGEDALFALCRRAWSYRDLPRAAFDDVIRMLSEGASPERARSGARLHRDGLARVVKGRRGARLAALTSGGAIPETGTYKVIAEPDQAVVGTLDEDFAIDSSAGDIFLLGNDSWRILRVEKDRVRVTNAHGAPPTIPFWRGEAPGRTQELSLQVSQLRAELERRLADRASTAQWLGESCGLCPSGAEQVVAYLSAGAAALGALPTQDALIAERFFDEAGGMQLVVHAPFGARINRAFGLALRKRFCASFDFELQAAATDEGVLLSLGPQHSFPLESVFDFLVPATVEEVLTQAVLAAPVFGVRWRWAATRSLAVLRHSGGRRVPFNILRMRTDDLLSAVFPSQSACQENVSYPLAVPDHPLVNETLRDCLTEAMDLPGLLAVLERVQAREVRLIARDTPEPSPLCHEILGSAPYAYLDDAPLEERRARAVYTRRTLAPRDAVGLGALDPAAIATVMQEAWPQPRDADEAHDALLSLGLVPAAQVPTWTPLLETLACKGRAVCVDRAGGRVWIAAERIALVEAAGAVDPAALPAALRVAPLTGVPIDRDDALAQMLRGWMCLSGPLTEAVLARHLGVSQGRIAIALAILEGQGAILRGCFTSGGAEGEWCERGLLARIHRLTIGKLRREIEPVSAADFLRFLLRWQHVHEGTQLHGAAGAAEVLGQLQGFQAPAAAWESELLPSRIARYEPGLLDQLCFGGEVVWARISRAEPEADGAPRSRAAPGRSTPIALVRREDLPWLLEAAAADGQGHGAPANLDPEAAAVHALLGQRGALFQHELRTAVGCGAALLDEALWQLVAAGLVTCDGFGAVRKLVDPRSASRPGAVSGRWALLRPALPGAPEPRAAFAEQPAWLVRLARLYLSRYGVVFRDVLAREHHVPPWRELLLAYRRMEARGELRGGRFVAGFSGEQFALPEAVDTLRTVRRSARAGTERAQVSALDPLNLVGILTPGGRVPAQGANRVVYVDGSPQPERPLPSIAAG